MLDLGVRYVDGEATRVEYHSMTYGLVRFHVDGGTAVIDKEWDEVDHSRLKDGYEPDVYTEDVVAAVSELPFIEEVAHPDVG